jgi:hypothetical protein
MRKKMVLVFFMALAATHVYGADDTWYVGDDRCPAPKDDGTYSAPYHALDHRQEYPTFHGADKSGWSCSYQKDDGVIVQYGDSRTPQQQWLDLWGGNYDKN